MTTLKKTNNTNELCFIIPNEKQKKQWDKLVYESNEGNIYALSWYLDCVSNNQWGLITNAQITTGLPIAFKKRTGYKNVYQPFYTMYFDVINPMDEIDNYLDVIQHDFHKIHITTQSYNHNLIGQARKRQEMRLDANFIKNYSENAIRQLKKAEKSNLVFESHSNAKEVVSIFRNNKGRELKEYKSADFKKLEDLIDSSIKHNHGFCARVKKNEEVLASGFFLTYKNRIIFLKGGVSDEGKKTGAMYFLMDRIINLNVNTFQVFDFGGSNNKNVGDFYRKLGGKDVQYFEIELDKRNILQKVIGKMRKK